MPVHSQHEHGVIPSRPPTGLAPLGDAQLDVQPEVALGLGKRLNLDGNTSAGYAEEELMAAWRWGSKKGLHLEKKTALVEKKQETWWQRQH